MSIQFKHFVTVPFKEAIENIFNCKEFSEEEILIVHRFKTKYQKELEIFSNRWGELKKVTEDELKLAENDEEKSKEILQKDIGKVQELLDCSSELKPLDYNKIKKARFTPHEFGILEPVLKDIPVE